MLIGVFWKFRQVMSYSVESHSICVPVGFVKCFSTFWTWETTYTQNIQQNSSCCSTRFHLFRKNHVLHLVICGRRAWIRAQVHETKTCFHAISREFPIVSVVEEKTRMMTYKSNNKWRIASSDKQEDDALSWTRTEQELLDTDQTRTPELRSSFIIILGLV
jgi:hypothetical protein